jgi:hypothetical protein
MRADFGDGVVRRVSDSRSLANSAQVLKTGRGSLRALNWSRMPDSRASMSEMRRISPAL